MPKVETDQELVEMFERCLVRARRIYGDREPSGMSRRYLTDLENKLYRAKQGLICAALKVNGERCLNKVTETDSCCSIHSKYRRYHPRVKCQGCGGMVTRTAGKHYLARQSDLKRDPGWAAACLKGDPLYLHVLCQGCRKRIRERLVAPCVVCKGPAGREFGQLVCRRQCGLALAKRALRSNFSFEVER